MSWDNLWIVWMGGRHRKSVTLPVSVTGAEWLRAGASLLRTLLYLLNSVSCECSVYSKSQITATKISRLWKLPGDPSLSAQYKFKRWPQNPSKHWKGNEKVLYSENITPFWWESGNQWDSCCLCVKMYTECLHYFPLSFCQAVQEGKADEDEKEAENLQELLTQ